MSNSNLQNSQPLQSGSALPVDYTLQDYKIIQILAEDDYSISYLATEQSQHTKVILKEYLPRSLSQRDQVTANITPKTLLSKQAFEWGLAEYREEAYDLININHPNIINVTSYFEAHSTAYKVIDAIGGITLEQYAKDKTLSETEILSLIKPLLDGLEVIHASGHIHSDLTPSHILIQDEISKPVITHLGDASHIFRHHEKEIPLMVSPGYSPCEHYYANDKQGAWTDIYALGCILYRLISGITPHSSASRLTGIADHGKDPLIPASEIAQQLEAHTYSEPLLSAIDHAIQLQRRDRPQTISEWKSELGIQTETIIETFEPNPSNPSNLSIAGVPTIPSDSSSKEIAINFEAISQISPEENPSKLKRFALIGTFASTMLASLAGSYHYLTLSPTKDRSTETNDIHSSQFSTKRWQVDNPTIDLDIRQTSNSALTPEELAVESYSHEELLIVPPIENTDYEEDLTPQWLLDVPLTKDKLSLQQFEDALIANEVITLPIILRYANRQDVEIDHTAITTLANLTSTHQEVPNLVIASTITPFIKPLIAFTQGRDTSHQATRVVTREVTNNTPQKVANVVRNDNQRRQTPHSQPQQVHHTNKHRNKKSKQQYQKEWVAAQRRKKTQGKTKQQYQKEWAAKQNQLQKRVEWKRRKEHLKKVKARKTVQQIEKGLLDDKDW